MGLRNSSPYLGMSDSLEAVPQKRGIWVSVWPHVDKVLEDSERAAKQQGGMERFKNQSGGCGRIWGERRHIEIRKVGAAAI